MTAWRLTDEQRISCGQLRDELAKLQVILSELGDRDQMTIAWRSRLMFHLGKLHATILQVVNAREAS